jgi:hypothetical protein
LQENADFIKSPADGAEWRCYRASNPSNNRALHDWQRQKKPRKANAHQTLAGSSPNGW